jgi:hypothetical protein
MQLRENIFWYKEKDIQVRKLGENNAKTHKTRKKEK